MSLNERGWLKINELISNANASRSSFDLMPKPVLIHCALGHGRTGMVTAAVLVASGEAQTAADAIAMIQTVRPGVKLNKAQRLTLEQIG